MLITATWKVTLGDPVDGGVVLLDFGEYTPEEPKIARDGSVDPVKFIGADFASFIPRKNVSHTLTFSRVKKFSSPASARAFLLEHTASLPARPALDCKIELPSGGGLYVLRGAVLAPGSYNARTESELFIADYRLTGGKFEGSASGGGGGGVIVPPPITVDMMRQGKATIANGAESAVIEFDPEFPVGTAVVVNATIAKPSGSGSNIFATVRDDLVSETGFTVELSAPTPDANHKLNWSAIGT